jgi:FixJ family two-component response regulator
MPAPVIVVDDDQDTRGAAFGALRSAGLEVAAFDDPMTALDAIDKESRARVLVSRTSFGVGKLHGVALARMLRRKQLLQDGESSLRCIFIGEPGDLRHAADEGEFVAAPVAAQALVDAVRKALME